MFNDVFACSLSYFLCVRLRMRVLAATVNREAGEKIMTHRTVKTVWRLATGRTIRGSILDGGKNFYLFLIRVDRPWGTSVLCASISMLQGGIWMSNICFFPLISAASKIINKNYVCTLYFQTFIFSTRGLPNIYEYQRSFSLFVIKKQNVLQPLCMYVCTLLFN